MIEVDLKTLEAIKSLEADHDPRWITFRNWIGDNAFELSRKSVHQVPDPSDVNFITRFSIQRGFAMALDTLINTIEEVDGAIVMQKAMDAEMEELKKAADVLATEALS